MTVRRLAAVDAQTYWMSASIPNDQFLLFAFDTPATDLGESLGVIRRRAQACADFRLCIAETGFWSYPVWAPREVGAEQIVVHELREPTWSGCLAAVAGLADEQLDARAMTWRLHVFPEVAGVPGVQAGAVAVLQISHALGDGIRSSALVAYLFGRAGALPAVTATRVCAAMLPARALRAGRAHRRLQRDTDAGLVPPQAFSRPVLRTNTRPTGPRHVRTVICDRSRLRGPTVTVGVLAAVSGALEGHLRALGDDPSRLGAEVPMARRGAREANNHYGNVGVDLYPGEEFGRRVEAIAAELGRRRRRAAHPAMPAESAATAAIPAALLRWGVQQFDPDIRADTVIGNTVVSSVNRGPKDLAFGDASVLLTAGLPALSPMMGLTHGVHGIGDTIAVSVHAAESSIGDIDAYMERLHRELRAGQ